MSPRRPPPAAAGLCVLALVAAPATGLAGCASGPAVEEVARYGPDTTGLVEPGLRVDLGPDTDLRALGVPDGQLRLPPPAAGVRRLALTYEACELVDVEPVVTDDGQVRVAVERDDRVSCAQPQYWVSVVEVAPG